MNKKLTLFIDQYGNRFFATTVKELRAQIDRGSSRVSKMYHSRQQNQTIHVGHVIGSHWLTAYQPVENAV